MYNELLLKLFVIKRCNIINQKTKGILITIIGAICWGISGCFGQFLFSEKGMTALWLVTVRLICSGLILIITGLIFNKRKMFDVFKSKSDIKSLLYFSFFGMLTAQLTYFLTIEYSNAGTATVLQSISSTLILLYICFKEFRFPTKIETFVLTIATFGTFILTTGGNISTMNISSLALTFGLLSAIAAMLYNLLSLDLIKKYGVYSIVGFSMALSGVFLMIFTKPWNTNINFDKQTIIGLLGVIIIGTVIAYSLFLKGISMIGPFMGSLIGNLEPVTAIAVSLLFLGSVFSVMEFVGIVLILSSVVIISVYSKN